MSIPIWFALSLSISGSLPGTSGQQPADPVQAPAEQAPATPAPTEWVGPSYHFGDFDADGLEDVYVVDPLGADQLFRNLGTGAFEEVTALHGLAQTRGSRMALWWDFDGDRALDLYVASAEGQSKLFQNSGLGFFTDVTSISGLAHGGAELGAHVLDYDGDSCADLHVLTEQGDLLFHNLGGGTFERVALPTLGRNDTASDHDQAPADSSSADPASDAVLATAASEAEVGALQRRIVRPYGQDRSAGLAATSAAVPPIVGAAAPTLGGASIQPAVALCPPTIKDQALGSCLLASSSPTLGMLYPLSTNFFVSTLGNVGIGTTSPTDKLDVAGGVNVDFTELNTGTTTNSLRFGPFNSGEGLASKRTAGGNQLGLDFYTAHGNRMSITNGGNVGVGTTAPSEKLSVAGGVRVDQGNVNTGTTANALLFGAGATGEGIASKRTAGGNQAGLDLYTSGTNRMAITSGGNVGIGTTTPEARVHAQANSAGAVTANGFSVMVAENNAHSYVSVLSPDASERGLLFGEPSNNIAGSLVYNSSVVPDGFDFRTNGSSSARLAITNIGNVGIGTTAPSEKLSVVGGVRVDDGNANAGTTASALLFGAGATGEGIASKRNAGGNQFGLDLYTSGTNRMAITGGGAVGVGTTTPEARMHVHQGSAGAVTANGFSGLVAENNADCFVSVLSPDASERGILFGEPSHNAAGGIIYNNGANPDGLQLRTNGNNTRMAITGTGNVGIGTTSPGELLEVSGPGATARLRNTNDPGGAFVGNNFSAVQLGLYNPTGGGWGSIPAGAKRSLFGMDNTGQVGSLTNNFGSAPTFKNVLDDGTGKARLGPPTAPGVPNIATLEVDGGFTFGGSGVRAEAKVIDGSGLIGINRNILASPIAAGVVGLTFSPVALAVLAFGGFGGSGPKFFIQPHPTDPSKEVFFACLEGNENGTYFRGSSRLVGGRMVIDVPEEFRLVSESKGLTVQVTPIGVPALLWVESKDLDHIVVLGNADAEFDYQVNGVRRGYAKFEAVRENNHYIPSVRGVPFGTQYPDALRDVLVQSGILNPDYTPNEETALKMGWTLVDADSPEAKSGLPLPRARASATR